MNERDIMHENGIYWVGRNRRCNALIVYKTGTTHSVSDSAYCNNAKGLSIAIARCNYLAKSDSLRGIKA